MARTVIAFVGFPTPMNRRPVATRAAMPNARIHAAAVLAAVIAAAAPEVAVAQEPRAVVDAARARAAVGVRAADVLDITVADATSNAFSHPLPTLRAEDRRAFSVGNALFRANWVTAPASAKGLDGLGPLFNARSCSACHLLDGRSQPPRADEAERHGLLVRIGVPVAGGPDAPHPQYGGQVQDAAIPGVAPEARVDIAWDVVPGTYGDGEPFELLRPTYTLAAPAYGPVGDAVLGGRTAPHMAGLGLLAAIPDAALRALADPDDRDGDGVSGRVHVLPDGRIGRFGWKATKPTVREQVAGAFVHDMGITSSLHPSEPLTAAQDAARAAAAATAATDGEPEITDAKLDRIVFYASALAPPSPRGGDAPAVAAGRGLFTRFGCAACHVPEWTSGDPAWHPAAAGRRFQPYTDLLLHDLGPELADGKRDGDALPAEWRTAPLWGIGLFPVVNGHERLLHDGRARGPAEAILWHGGEALAAREAFRLAPGADRAALVAFVRSL
jgi:CxxC motif-containing protein (DUF1111 family)